MQKLSITVMKQKLIYRTACLLNVFILMTDNSRQKAMKLHKIPVGLVTVLSLSL